MAKKKISQVRKEYYKQEQRIRNIIKREFKRGINVYEQEVLPPTPKRVTKSAVQRLKEITPIVVRSYGTVDVGSVVHTWREVQDASDYQIEQNRIQRKLYREDSEEQIDRPLSTPKDITNRALLGIRKLQERDQKQFARDLEYDEETRYKSRPEEYKSIDDLVQQNLNKIREQMNEHNDDSEIDDEQAQEMGDIANQARAEYEQMVEDEEAYWDRTGLTFEADTIMENLYDSFSHDSNNTAVLDFLRDMTDYRISELGLDPLTGEVSEEVGRTLLAQSLKRNTSEIKSLMNVIVFESDTERIMRATSSMMSLLFEGEVPSIYRTKLDAIMYINMGNIRNKKARRRIVKEYFD